MTFTSAVVGAIRRSAVRLSRHGPSSTPYRPISTSVTLYRGRDVLAKYQARPPLVAAKDHVELDTGSTSLSDDFLTSSTQPAGTSFQTVPPPSSDAAQHGSYSKAPVPAMVAPESSTSGSPLNSDSEHAQRRKEIIVQGVPIPPKPTPPGEEDCCMSGCVHCVYTIYADDLELYTDALESARKALTKAQVPTSQWPEEVQTKSSGAGEVRDAEVKKVEESVDPSMAAFLALEAKMRKKQAA